MREDMFKVIVRVAAQRQSRALVERRRFLNPENAPPSWDQAPPPMIQRPPRTAEICAAGDSYSPVKQHLRGNIGNFGKCAVSDCFIWRY